MGTASHTDEQKNSYNPSKECFVICPIGSSGSDTRKRSNQIFKHIVSPIVDEYGYSVDRADMIEQSGQITTQIIDKLLNVDLVIADLTDQNPNVFYELAIRHAVRKPFVHLMATGQVIPFDIQGLRAIFVDYKDLDSVHEAKQQLKGALQAIESGVAVETPVTYTIDLQQLRQSENSEARGIADIMQEMQSIKRAVLSGTSSTRRANPNHVALRRFVEYLSSEDRLQIADGDVLITQDTSSSHDAWARGLIDKIDPWAGAPPAQSYSDEPPF